MSSPSSVSELPTGGAEPAVDHAAVQRMLKDDIASNTLGIELIELSRGGATVTMTVSETMLNGHAIVHGGYVFLLADTAFACACNSYGPVTVAAGAQITYIAPVHRGERLVARAIERARYGRNGIYDICVSGPNGVVAEFRGTSRTIGRGADGGAGV